MSPTQDCAPGRCRAAHMASQRRRQARNVNDTHRKANIGMIPRDAPMPNTLRARKKVTSIKTPLTTYAVLSDLPSLCSAQRT